MTLNSATGDVTTLLLDAAALASKIQLGELTSRASDVIISALAMLTSGTGMAIQHCSPI